MSAKYQMIPITEFVQYFSTLELVSKHPLKWLGDQWAKPNIMLVLMRDRITGQETYHVYAVPKLKGSVDHISLPFKTTHVEGMAVSVHGIHPDEVETAFYSGVLGTAEHLLVIRSRQVSLSLPVTIDESLIQDVQEIRFALDALAAKIAPHTH